MDQTRLHQLEEQCIQDCDPPCTAHCPAHVNVRDMLRFITTGDFSSAYNTLRKTIPFPEIISRTCDQPCQQGCNRETLGGVINVAALELACCLYNEQLTQKLTPMPKKSGTVAVVGGGISGMTAACDLAKKGYQVTLFEEKSELGGALWDLHEEQLPRGVIRRESALLEQVNVEVHCDQRIDLSAFPFAEYGAVYLALGSEGREVTAFEADAHGRIIVDFLTYQTSRPSVFAGGSMLHPSSSIFSLSDGRRAAVSIDRFLQRVSMTASRSNEGASETRLYTNLEGIAVVPTVIPAEAGRGYSSREAQLEAQRCLLCECMECVKVCEYLDAYGSYPRKYVRDIYNNLSIIMRQRRGNKFINSCTLCGLCAEVCPTDLDMGEVISETRGTMVSTGKMPISAHDFALRDMAFSNSQRFAFTHPEPGSRICEYLFFPGCQLAASNPEYISQIYEDLLPVLGDVGLMLRCCGAPADWSGEEALFMESGDVMRREWEQLGKPKFILACSSCNQMLKKLIPDVETVPLWEVLLINDRIAASRNALTQRFKVHDPCTSRYEVGWQDSARGVIKRLGVDYSELRMSRSLTECCGYGGVVWLANPEMVHRINQRRIHEDESEYITYCVMCRDLFAAEGKPTLHLLDLVYGRDPATLAVRRPPDYSQRHENRVRVKQRMERLLLGKESGRMESYEKIKLQLSSELRDVLEARLILVEDLQKVIEHADESGEYFVNKVSGHLVSSYKPNLITYWVEFVKQDDSFVVFDAYSHRMVVGGDTSV